MLAGATFTCNNCGATHDEDRVETEPGIGLTFEEAHPGATRANRGVGDVELAGQSVPISIGIDLCPLCAAELRTTVREALYRLRYATRAERRLAWANQPEQGWSG